MPSPTTAPPERSSRHEPVRPYAEVEAFVDDDTVAQPSWCNGELREWTFHESFGWTGYVQYSTGPRQNRLGTFLARCVRSL
jgi:hypothetical protein